MNIFVMIFLGIAIFALVTAFMTKYLFLNKTSIEMMVLGIGLILGGISLKFIDEFGQIVVFIGLCFLVSGFAKKNNQ